MQRGDLEKILSFGDRAIGTGHACFIIAEAGVNHNGDLQMAHQLVDAAADAGADAVKFQTWITEEVLAPGAPKAAYQSQGAEDTEDQFTMVKRLELPFEWHAELKAHAEDREITFLSTPDEISSARFLCDLGVPVIKIGSAELTNLPYLHELATLGKPLILSTGMATLPEIRIALDEIRRTSDDCLVALLYCVSSYPAPEEEMNLRCIATLRDEFHVPVGLSDHTTGAMAATLGAAMGMSIYERHITLDRRLPGPDQSASTEPQQFTEIIRSVRQAEKMMGSGIKALAESEKDVAKAVRRVLAYRRDLLPGHVIAPGDISPLRCGRDGLPPADLDRFQGGMLSSAVTAGTPVRDADFL